MTLEPSYYGVIQVNSENSAAEVINFLTISLRLSFHNVPLLLSLCKGNTVSVLRCYWKETTSTSLSYSRGCHQSWGEVDACPLLRRKMLLKNLLPTLWMCVPDIRVVDVELKVSGMSLLIGSLIIGFSLGEICAGYLNCAVRSCVGLPYVEYPSVDFGLDGCAVPPMFLQGRPVFVGCRVVFPLLIINTAHSLLRTVWTKVEMPSQVPVILCHHQLLIHGTDSAKEA